MKEIVENKIKIYVPDDIEKVTSGTRESIYFLNSLRTLFKEHVVLPDSHNPELYQNRLKRIEECYTDFEKLENIIYNPKETQVLPNGTYSLEIDLIKLTKILVKYIELKERIDKLQLEILEYLFNIENEIITALIPKEEFLANLRMSYSAKILTYSAFEHSKDEDRIDNYRIYINDKKDAKKYSKKHSHPIYLKVHNYDFQLKKFRNLYKMTKKSQVELLGDSSRLREEEELRKINRKQFEINRKIQKLTILATILGVLGFIYASISTYYLVTDDSAEKEILSDKRIEKKLQNIESELKQTKVTQWKKDSVSLEVNRRK